MADEKLLLEALTRDLLAETANLLNISQSWLETVNGDINANRNQWYKQTAQIAMRLSYLVKEDYESKILYLRSKNGHFTPDALDDFRIDDSLVVAIVVPITINGVSFQRYEFWGGERWTYGKAQAEACALLHFTADHAPLFYPAGYSIKSENFIDFLEGRLHISEISNEFKWETSFDSNYLYKNSEYNKYSGKEYAEFSIFTQILERTANSVQRLILFLIIKLQVVSFTTRCT